MKRRRRHHTKAVKSNARFFKRISDSSGLSPAEKNVAAYAIEGLTNAEVGKKLRISAVTVGVHLTRIYDKTRVNTRQELQWLMQKGKKTTKKAPKKKVSKKKKSKKKAKSRWRRSRCNYCDKKLQVKWKYCPICGDKI